MTDVQSLPSVQAIVSAKMRAEREGVPYTGMSVQEAVTLRMAAERAEQA